MVRTPPGDALGNFIIRMTTPATVPVEAASYLPAGSFLVRKLDVPSLAHDGVIRPVIRASYEESAVPTLSVRCSDLDAARLRAAAAARELSPSALVRAAVARVAAEVLRELDDEAAAGVIRQLPEDPTSSSSTTSTSSPPTTSSTTSPRPEARAGADRRLPKRAYGEAECATWAEHLAEHGDRRAARWPERRERGP